MGARDVASSKAFGDNVEQVISRVLTEQNIKNYFETMGAELSRCANEQWR